MRNTLTLQVKADDTEQVIRMLLENRRLRVNRDKANPAMFWVELAAPPVRDPTAQEHQ